VQLLARDENTRDAYNAANNFAAYLTVWASITAISSNERMAGGDTYVSSATHRVNMRYPASVAVKAQDRVQYGTRVFDILSVVNRDERNRELDLMCLEIQGGAARGA
jgi:SPP1 family predicted phage head-tail adaptor